MCLENASISGRITDRLMDNGMIKVFVHSFMSNSFNITITMLNVFMENEIQAKCNDIKCNHLLKKAIKHIFC